MNKHGVFCLSAFLLVACSGDKAPLGGAWGTDGNVSYGDGGAPVDANLLEAGSAQEAGVLTPDGWTATNQPTCAGSIFACSDGIDNDGDGKIDSQDPECVGPCDNDEASFATGIPGDNSDACKQDCFFDGNSGSGDDGCDWNLKCDPLNPGANLAKACPYDATFANCPPPQSQTCQDICLGMTPNGCDCFGCCIVYNNGQPHTVFLGSGPTCTTATPENCPPCTQVASCLNDCGTCELCLGRSIADLPPSCFTPTGDGGVSAGDGGTAPQLPTCSGGLTPCITSNDCPQYYFCLTGCCIHAPQ